MRIKFVAMCLLAIAASALPCSSEPGEVGRQPAVAAAPVRASQIRGIVRAVEQAAFSVDQPLYVTTVKFREGETFSAGDLLVEFDCRRSRAEAASAMAVHREGQLQLESNLQLAKHRAIGEHEVEISRARVAKAAAELDALASRLDRCRINAPFGGRVTELAVNPFELAPAGKPYLAIVGNGRFEVELIVPSTWLPALQRDADFVFHADETRRAYQLKVSRVGASVDAVSQTVKVFGVFETPPRDIMSGMSGTASFADRLGDGR